MNKSTTSRYDYLWFGWVFHALYLSMIQDLMGKEKYIATAQAAWADTKWWIWPLIALAIFMLLKAMERLDASTENKITEAILKHVKNIDANMGEMKITRG